MAAFRKEMMIIQSPHHHRSQQYHQEPPQRRWVSDWRLKPGNDDVLVLTSSAVLIVSVCLDIEKGWVNTKQRPLFTSDIVTTYGDFSGQYDSALGALQRDRGPGHTFHPLH